MARAWRTASRHAFSVATLAVSAEDVERLEAGERLARRLEPQERVDADRLVGRAEVADRAERVADDQDPLLGEPKRHLLPEPAPDDRDHLERRLGHSVEGRHVQRDAEAARDVLTVTLVAVEQLDHASRLAELPDPFVDPRPVEDVRQPHGVPDSDRVRGALEGIAFEGPAEAVLELVDETELHGETMPVAEPNDISNAEVADRLESFASLLDLSGAQPYASRAYRRAAEMIRETKAPIADLVRAGRARELRGIGPGIEARLRELVETGRIAELDELERDVAPELVGLGRLLGFGPKRAGEIGRVLGVRTVDEFRAAAAEGRLAEVPGIGGSSTTGPRTRSTSTWCSRLRSRQASRSRSNGLRAPARPPRRARPSGDRSRRADRLLDGRPLGARPREHAALGRHSPPRLGHGGEHPEHAPPVRNSQALRVRPRASLRFQPNGEIRHVSVTE